MESPDSVLANSAPPPKFTSRYSDPTHKASSGDLISLITGGHLSAGGGLQGIVGKVSGQFGGQNSAQGAPGAQPQSNTQPARGLNIKKFLGKVSKEHISHTVITETDKMCRTFYTFLWSICPRSRIWRKRELTLQRGEDVDQC